MTRYLAIFATMLLITLGTGLAQDMGSQAPGASDPGVSSDPGASQESSATEFEGELVSVDTTAKTLSVRNASGEEMSFSYDESTQISGADGTVEGLANQTGTKVKVSYDASTQKASHIEVTS